MQSIRGAQAHSPSPDGIHGCPLCWADGEEQLQHTSEAKVWRHFPCCWPKHSIFLCWEPKLTRSYIFVCSERRAFTIESFNKSSCYVGGYWKQWLALTFFLMSSLALEPQALQEPCVLAAKSITLSSIPAPAIHFFFGATWGNHSSASRLASPRPWHYHWCWGPRISSILGLRQQGELCLPWDTYILVSCWLPSLRYAPVLPHNWENRIRVLVKTSPLGWHLLKPVWNLAVVESSYSDSKRKYSCKERLCLTTLSKSGDAVKCKFICGQHHTQKKIYIYILKSLARGMVANGSHAAYLPALFSKCVGSTESRWKPFVLL